MRKLIAILCITLLMVSLSACGSGEKDYSNQTVMGKVVSIDGGSVILQVATMNMPEGMNGNTGNIPQGQMPNDENGTPPEIPNGENGAPPQGQTPPTDGNGSMPQMPSGGEIPESDLGVGQGGQPPQNEEKPDMFGEDGEKITISLDGVMIKIESGTEITEGTKDDINVDFIVMVEFGDNNTVKSITVKTQVGFGSPNNNQQMPSTSGDGLSV